MLIVSSEKGPTNQDLSYRDNLVDYTLSDDVTISQISYPFGYRVLTECDAQNVDILLDL